MPSEIHTKERESDAPERDTQNERETQDKREEKLDTDDETVAALHDHLVEHEVEEIADHSRLRVPQIYQVVRHEGETEMARPATRRAPDSRTSWSSRG